MSILKRLLGKSDAPRERVRVCVECGMPIAEHKSWCAIFRGQLERNGAAGPPPAAVRTADPAD